MYYAIYKSIRNSAWQCILDFKLYSLPIDVLQITRTAGIRVIKNSLANDLLPDEKAKTYFDGTDWIIIYNDKNPTEISRVAIAHELGHIFLGHDLKNITYSNILEFEKRPKAEQQANSFAVRLLCPSFMIWDMGLYSSTEIAKRFMVTEDIAKQRADRIATLYKRNKFLTNAIEREIYINFKIKEHNERIQK